MQVRRIRTPGIWWVISPSWCCSQKVFAAIACQEVKKRSAGRRNAQTHGCYCTAMLCRNIDTTSLLKRHFLGGVNEGTTILIILILCKRNLAPERCPAGREAFSCHFKVALERLLYFAVSLALSISNHRKLNSPARSITKIVLPPPAAKTSPVSPS